MSTLEVMVNRPKSREALEAHLLHKRLIKSTARSATRSLPSNRGYSPDHVNVTNRSALAYLIAAQVSQSARARRIIAAVCAVWITSRQRHQERASVCWLVVHVVDDVRAVMHTASCRP